MLGLVVGMACLLIPWKAPRGSQEDPGFGRRVGGTDGRQRKEATSKPGETGSNEARRRASQVQAGSPAGVVWSGPDRWWSSWRSTAGQQVGGFGLESRGALLRESSVPARDGGVLYAGLTWFLFAPLFFLSFSVSVSLSPGCHGRLPCQEIPGIPSSSPALPDVTVLSPRPLALASR